MGRRPGSARMRSLLHQGLAAAFSVAMLLAAFVAAQPVPAVAQSLSALMGGGAPTGTGKDKMLVEAKELVYDRDKDTVEARGDVQIYYQGKVLEADKVIYDRKTKRLYAEGNAKLTEPDGTVAYGARFDLTDDFRNGFVESLTSVTKDKARITSPRAERTEGETTVFEKATYTACAPCAEHPERPPLWQIRATRIIHNGEEQTIYYENATIEMLGIPLLWVPFLSTPDPTVKRKSGLLPPRYIYNSFIGYGVGIPIYWAMAPNYDLTVTPTFLTQQGVLGEAVWRQRLMNGAYSVRAAGIFQQDSAVFAGENTGDFRGTIQSTGKFDLSQHWSYGWNAALWTDKFFYNDYKIAGSNSNFTYDYFQDSISTAYLTGKGDRGYFDLRGYYFFVMGPSDVQKQQPIAAPVLDYNKAFDLPRDRYPLGGELTFDFNFTNLSQEIAGFHAANSSYAEGVDKAFGTYNVCAVYTPGKCLIQGIGGDYDRVSAQLSWRRNIIDPVGGVWQPFAFARLDGTWASLNTTDSLTFSNGASSSTISNASQTAFFGKTTETSARAMPGVGMEYRFPLVASTSWATHVFEPIAQLVVRPNETTSGNTINEDAQSLVFDDTTLFEWNKFSGYDRFEGGTRLNAGAQYTMSFNSGGSAHALVGQSFQLAGRNSYAVGDDANVGLDSGLQNAQSYYVTQFSLAPNANYSLVTKANFDNQDLALKRLEVGATANFGHLSGNILYQRFAAEPDIGFETRREGVSISSTYNFTDHYNVSGAASWDLSRYLLDGQLNTKTDRLVPATYSVGVGYTDDCTTFAVRYISGYEYGAGVLQHSNSVLLSLTLRTLGGATVNQAITTETVPDGLGAAEVR
jgi:LPS-assembly protein